jgi:hypothetical protein
MKPSLSVAFIDHSVWLRIPQPGDENSDVNDVAPNVTQVAADGTVTPVDYEAMDIEAEEDSPL